MNFSPLARPPIQPEEAQNAPHSICANHNGLVRQTGDVPGRVFWCPIGRQFWRYNPEQSSFTAPLRYPKSGVV